MSFILQTVTRAGLTLGQVRGNTLRIGRGTNAELRSENPAVALEHAVIEGDANGFEVTDRGSITGTYVNRRPVEKARLNKGDVIEIGDLRIEVQVAEVGKPLFVRVTSTESASSAFAEEEEAQAPTVAPAGGGATVKAPKIDYASAYKLRRTYLTKASVIATLLIISFLVVAEVAKPERQKAFMPGEVSSAHKLVINDCSACHTPWKGVSEAGCLGCHAPQKIPHSDFQARTPPCADCHSEHRGQAKLTVVSDPTCTRCHASLAAHVVAGHVPRNPTITSFAVHPGFTYPPDADTLHFNHAKHLKAIRNAKGVPEQLKCEQCHEGAGEPAPVSFERHCQRCHRLTFSSRFPDVEVPHGKDQEAIYGVVALTYAGNRDIVGKSAEEVRRILTVRPPPLPSQDALLNAREVITKQCSLCHPMQRTGERFVAAAPVIRHDWLDSTHFSHGKHRVLTRCEDCHDSARNSTKTSDVLMPARERCTGCHAAGAGKTPSSCITCHEYHGRSKNQLSKTMPPVAKADVGGGSGMLESVLFWAIVILLVVVLVPVGLALYQRIKPAPPERAAAPRPPVPPPPPAAAKIPPLAPPPAPPAPAPVSAAPPTVAGTVMVDLPQAASAPSSTEAVQWYGMLACTGGPLEGQRFVVEETGFYIGRDSTLSKVVINDTRVSKRHVRIIPRNGKVFAVDQSSTNGTFLGKAGGQRITEVQLKRGDVLVLADDAASFVYQV
ncbi:MAG TPA: FHA domain-containing protein [Thermoanaerobaculia bacterium]|jgi:pSer/pThr/pTyr-binding forkhead associated (FHA) protein|nr:FHA domain-containing protein [Thermoanaerobaculia bacterium]